MPPPMPADDGSLRWELRRNCRLTPRQLLVGCGALAGVRRHLVLPAKAARVEAPAGPGALVTVRGPGGAEVRLGRHLRQHDRSVLAHDLRRALLQAG